MGQKRYSVLIAGSDLIYATQLGRRIQMDQNLCLQGVLQSGKEVLEQVRQNCPDLLVLDLVMPYLDGLAVLEEIAGCDVRPRVMVVSNIAADDILHKTFELGAEDYIRKPQNVDVIARRIRDFAREKELPPQENRTFEAAPQQSLEQLENAAGNYLRELGIMPHLLGYQYLRRAMALVIQEPQLINALTLRLYPMVAEVFDTTAQRVERSMRHAIENGWIRGDLTAIDRMFGYTVDAGKGKPTVGALIAMLTDRMRMDGIG
ncbi:MAG: sporulation transcription factor Spo0A [Christensenellales bacterium]